MLCIYILYMSMFMYTSVVHVHVHVATVYMYLNSIISVFAYVHVHVLVYKGWGGGGGHGPIVPAPWGYDDNQGDGLVCHSSWKKTVTPAEVVGTIQLNNSKEYGFDNYMFGESWAVHEEPLEG